MCKAKISKRKLIRLSIILILVPISLLLIFTFFSGAADFLISGGKASGKSRENKVITEYAHENGIALWKYPDEMVELLERNNETTEFVLEYPKNKDKKFDIDLSEFENSEAVPLFLQWDKRWGYEPYGSGIVATSGCGPVCLSMVSYYLLNDSSLDPLYISRFSLENGYYSWNNGTSWTLISEGSRTFGLEAKEIPLDKNVIINNLNDGNPIICVMGPGDFTSTGHYIVIIDYIDGGFKINDPNSVEKSNKLWYYEDIKDQFRNLWAMSVID